MAIQAGGKGLKVEMGVNGGEVTINGTSHTVGRSLQISHRGAGDVFLGDKVVRDKVGSSNGVDNALRGHSVSHVIVDEGEAIELQHVGTPHFDIKINGNVKSLSCDNGQVTADTIGSVTTISAPVTCDYINGGVQTMSGQVKAETIKGPMSTLSGSISR